MVKRGEKSGDFPARTEEYKVFFSTKTKKGPRLPEEMCRVCPGNLSDQVPVTSPWDGSHADHKSCLIKKDMAHHCWFSGEKILDQLFIYVYM